MIGYLCKINSMKTTARFLDGMAFEIGARQHRYTLDTAMLGGKDTAATPKEAVLGAILGCTGMDVVALFKKFKLDPAGVSLSAESELTDSHPKVFKQIVITYSFPDSTPADKACEAVELSMTKLCGVSAMVNPVSPIVWKIEIGGQITAEGKAGFERA
jgi:putative redox protein